MELEVEGMLFDEGTLQSLIPGHAYALRIRARTDVFGYTEWSAVDKHAVVVMPKIEDSDQPEAEAKGQTSSRCDGSGQWPPLNHQSSQALATYSPLSALASPTIRQQVRARAPLLGHRLDVYPL